MNSSELSDSLVEGSSKKSLKKEVRKKILEQLEFYFSDSNLTKDRFLKHEIQNSNDGFINLEIFLHFNKIRSLGVNLKDIRKSVKKSEILELNEEETMVKRKTPFVELTQKDIDKKTIYVENIQSNITYEDLKSLFEQYGNISYISLPKYQTTNKIKGFAFIEFEKKEDSKRAIEAFKDQLEDNEQIGKFPKCNAQIIGLEKKIKKVKEEIAFIENKQSNDNSEDNTDNDKKRKIENDQIDKPNKKNKNKSEWEKCLKVVTKKRWIKSKEEFLENQKKEINDLKSILSDSTKKLTEIKTKSNKPNISKIKCGDINRGSIIKVQLNLNNDKDYKIFNMGRKQFKEEFLKNFDDNIAYIDMEKNSNKIMIRCKSSESAKYLLENKSFLDGYSKNLLDGEEEDNYLEKIYSNRNKKQEKNEKKEQFKSKNLQVCQKSASEKKQETDKLENEISKSKHIKFDSNGNDV